MQRKTIEVIELLKAQNHTVSYKKRNDGGYLITSIDGKKFSGAQGNNYARQITGSSLSTASIKQRSKAVVKRIEKYNNILGKKTKERFDKAKRELKKYGLKPSKTKWQLYKEAKKGHKDVVRETIKADLAFTRKSEAFKEEFLKLKKEWESNPNLKGKIKWETTYKALQREGTKAIRKQLQRMTRYAEGYINQKNLEWFILRLKDFQDKKGTNLLDPVIEYCKKHAMTLKDDSVQRAYQYLYNLDSSGGDITNQTASELIAILSR